MNAMRYDGRQQLEEAEGYLALITGVASRFGLAWSLRQRLAMRALRIAHDAVVDPRFAWRRFAVMGQCLRILRRHRAAVRCLWKAVRQKPGRGELWIALAWSLRRAGRIDQAITVLTRGLEHIPDHAPLHFNLACYLAVTGHNDEAMTELVWALDIAPELQGCLRYETDFDGLRQEPTFITICEDGF